MAARTRTIRRAPPSTVDEARRAVLDFLSSDGRDDELHELSKAALKFLEQDPSINRNDTHRMRMAIVAWRVEKNAL